MVAKSKKTHPMLGIAKELKSWFNDSKYPHNYMAAGPCTVVAVNQGSMRQNQSLIGGESFVFSDCMVNSKNELILQFKPTDAAGYTAIVFPYSRLLSVFGRSAVDMFLEIPLVGASFGEKMQLVDGLAGTLSKKSEAVVMATSYKDWGKF